MAYRYAPFGTPSPIFTQPPVDVPPKGSKPLRNGFTSFEFTATYDHIMNAFVSQGLLLELHNNDQVRVLGRLPLKTRRSMTHTQSARELRPPPFT